MRHATYGFLSSIGLDSIHRCFHSWNKCVTSIKTKSLESIEFNIYKITKLICIHDSFQYFKLCLFWDWIELLVFNFISDPITLFSVRNMHIFDSNFPAVSCRKLIIDFSKCKILFSGKNSVPHWQINVKFFI